MQVKARCKPGKLLGKVQAGKPARSERQKAKGKRCKVQGAKGDNSRALGAKKSTKLKYKMHNTQYCKGQTANGIFQKSPDFLAVVLYVFVVC